MVTSDGIGHTVWVVDQETHIYTLNHLFDAVPALYIADGHHRTAAAIRYGQARRAAAREPTGDEPFESFMAVVFPHNQLKIMDYNRLVKDLNGLTSEQFLARLGETFTVAPAAQRNPSGTRHLRHVPGRPVVLPQGQARHLSRRTIPCAAWT